MIHFLYLYKDGKLWLFIYLQKKIENDYLSLSDELSEKQTSSKISQPNLKGNDQVRSMQGLRDLERNIDKSPCFVYT